MNSSDSSSHADTKSSEIAASEKDVQNLSDSFKYFINPFVIKDEDDTKVLHYISSGVAAKRDIE